MAEKVIVFNILKSLKNHMKMIFGIALLSMAVIWALLSFILVPNFQATSQLYIAQPVSAVAPVNTLKSGVDPQIVKAYSAMIKSRDVLSAAIAVTGSGMAPAELSDKVTVSNVPASQVLNITVNVENRKVAGEIANSLAAIAVREEWKQMKADNLSVIAKASVEEIPTVLEENVLYVLAIGGIFGTIVGILLAFIAELFNMLFRTGVLERRRKRTKFQTVFK